MTALYAVALVLRASERVLLVAVKRDLPENRVRQVKVLDLKGLTVYGFVATGTRRLLIILSLGIWKTMVSGVFSYVMKMPNANVTSQNVIRASSVRSFIEKAVGCFHWQ